MNDIQFDKFNAKIDYLTVHEIEGFETEIESCTCKVRHNEYASFVRVTAIFDIVNADSTEERAQFTFDDEIFFTAARTLELSYYISCDELILNRVIAANEDRREEIESMTLSNVLVDVSFTTSKILYKTQTQTKKLCLFFSLLKEWCNHLYDKSLYHGQKLSHSISQSSQIFSKHLSDTNLVKMYF